MKTIIKSALLASAILASTAASAATVTLNISDLVFTGPNFDLNATLLNAQATEAAFLGSLNGATVQENFESAALQINPQSVVVPGDVSQTENLSWVGASNSFSTNVGTFTLTSAGQGSVASNDSLNAANNLLMIEDSSTGEFGRQNIGQTGRWLDSNDARQVVWTLDAPLNTAFNAFGFYLADSADIAGKLTLTFADQNTVDFDLTTLLSNTSTNGSVRYVTVISDSSIVNSSVTFDVSVGNDGWGIDNVTVGSVPEPGSILLMGLGLLGLGAARRRTKAA